ncbi:phosphotransferase family protein [Natronobiforma cellulositropha]|uniref:phosphotransferase family protein n=1 Tax=Natronobiforma cellulositropha TaxID=1679076 RepID=UPI0021D588AD|nr:phosphotransferase [Natronobiforma cellulositropha]
MCRRPVPAADPEHVYEEIARTALETELRGVRRLAGGALADTSLLELAGDPARVVCKRGGASVWSGDVIEPLVVSLVGRESALPVPTVLASGAVRWPAGAKRGRATHERFACYSVCVGRTPEPYRDLEPPVLRRLVVDAGRLLGALHAANPGGFEEVGALARSEGGLCLVEPCGWHALDPGPLGRALGAWLGLPLAGEEGARPVLDHGDYRPGNVLADERGAITAVLDWGNAHVTTAGYALARAEAGFVDRHRVGRGGRRRLRHVFRAGYANHAPLPDGFERLAPRYKALWLAQSLANYARVARSRDGRTALRRQLESALERARHLHR